GAAAAAGAGGPAAAAANPLPGYVAIIRGRIEQAKKYPRLARENQIEGEATVSFRLQPDGALAQAELLASSGNRWLDRAALEAVRAAAPYPGFPGRREELPDSFRITVAFVLR
ncbi:MAG: TonB family protein, partial [Thermodesulfobacteriota bacterium]